MAKTKSENTPKPKQSAQQTASDGNATAGKPKNATKALQRDKRHLNGAPGRHGGTQSKPKQTKKQICIDLLSRRAGASLNELQQATGWQRHSVRGFLSGTVKKLPDSVLTAETSNGGPRRYHIVNEHKATRS